MIEIFFIQDIYLSLVSSFLPARLDKSDTIRDEIDDDTTDISRESLRTGYEYQVSIALLLRYEWEYMRIPLREKVWKHISFFGITIWY